MKKNLLFAVLAASTSLMAFAGCTNENTVSGKTIDVVEETMVVETQAPELNMTLDGFGMAGGMLSVTMSDGTEEEIGTRSFALEEGKTVGDLIAAQDIIAVDPFIMNGEYTDGEETDGEDPEIEDTDNGSFEGWIEYKVTMTQDEAGVANYAYERMSGETYYTTEELFEKQVPDYEVLYVAKWEEVSEEEYYKNYDMVDDGLDLFLTMYANGGYMWYDGEDPYDFDLGVYEIEKDQTFGLMLNDEDLTTIESDEYWFAGWTVYTGEAIEWLEEEPAEEIAETDMLVDIGEHGYGLIRSFKVVGEGLTSEELMEIVCEGTDYVAIAMWE